MTSIEISTATHLPEEQFGAGDLKFENLQDIESESDFTEIDFPKSRTIRFSEGMPVIQFSVDFQKVDTQMKNFASNNASV